MFQALRILSAVAVLSFLCVEAQASDPFRATSSNSISTSSLDAMGLSGMQALSHSDAAQIRGQGAVVWGRSYASTTVFGLHAEGGNGYRAWGRRGAAGANGSVAVVGGAIGTGNGGGFIVVGSAAGGFSAARSW
jgi:hypothetical protein